MECSDRNGVSPLSSKKLLPSSGVKCKKNSFTTIPRQSVKKSTKPHKNVSINVATMKHMHLKLTKIDIHGLEIPRKHFYEAESDVLFGCARIIPVDQIKSCSRNTPVKGIHLFNTTLATIHIMWFSFSICRSKEQMAASCEFYSRKTSLL